MPSATCSDVRCPMRVAARSVVVARFEQLSAARSGARPYFPASAATSSRSTAPAVEQRIEHVSVFPHGLVALGVREHRAASAATRKSKKRSATRAGKLGRELDEHGLAAGVGEAPRPPSAAAKTTSSKKCSDESATFGQTRTR